MDRAAFPAESRPKFFKHAIDLNKDPPESIRKFRIVRAMLFVSVERHRIGDFVRHDVDRHRQFQFIQRSHDRFVKIGNAARFEFNRALGAVALQNAQLMIDKIKTNLEGRGSMRNGRSR